MLYKVEARSLCVTRCAFASPGLSSNTHRSQFSKDPENSSCINLSEEERHLLRKLGGFVHLCGELHIFQFTSQF